MTWPTVQVNQLNMMGGELKEVERHFLFIGTGTQQPNVLQQVTSQTDLDAVLGKADTPLKQEVKAALLNAGQNWTAAVMEIQADDDWTVAAQQAQLSDSFEMIVLCDPIGIDAKAAITKAQALRSTLISKWGRFVRVMLSVKGIDKKTQTWAQYEAAVVSLQSTLAADGVMLVPQIFTDGTVGKLAGRLCNRAVTIADTPCRVKTGALLGDMTLPVDSAAEVLPIASLQNLEKNRISVPMWWPDFDGVYWADGRMLDVEGGDYQVVEYCRIMDKVARKLRVRAIARIGDRSLNSTPASIASTKRYFLRDMRVMAKSTTIAGVLFVGEIAPPVNDDMNIQWVTKTKVRIYGVVTPIDCPKQIEINLMLDLQLAEDA
ncbi:DUF2586 domain-containing protein [Photobacterium phosphoreum]|uniref:DUF2586 domain-containing protein n=1 Tax=Photobacterium phosphoreum TaxID=659 RepID=UPI000D17EB34|nr:DUF2586 domain-containing protein [Photobacterium phosphoreum]PSU35419.1 DUF2586 domain-containing protein [Photobacterium phosphoreum]